MKLIILDRDGVINYDSPNYICSPNQWQAIPGSLEAIARLNVASWTVTIATNQSGIGRGYYSEETLNNIHRKMQTELAAVGGHIDAIFYCPHTPDMHCECRKPQTGLLKKIAAYFHCDLTNVPMIGDSIKDIEVAQKMGCRPILVETGNGAAHKLEFSALLTAQKIPIMSNLSAAVDFLLQGRNDI